LQVKRTFKLTIEYDGSEFRGWQIQPDVRTVQGELKNAVEKLISGKFRIIGASRTDRGVHAEGQVVSLHLESIKFTPSELQKALNALLPPDIYVHSVEEVDPKFNARFNAKGKLYRYRIIPEKKSPIRRKYAWDGVENFSLETAKSVFERIKGEINFSGLIIGEAHENPITKITRSTVETHGDEVHFYIEGERFFYKMVRLLVGFTVAIATGREDENTLMRALRGERPKIFWIAPPEGLTLIKVFY